MRFDGKTNPQRASKLTIGELSGVTVPAHEGANVTMIKLSGDAETILKSAYTEALGEITLEANVRNQLEPMWDFNYALREAAENIIQDSDITDKNAAMREAVGDYIRSVISLFNQRPEATQMADNTTELQAQVDLFKALSEMTDAQKAHYEQLQDSEKADFLKLDSAARSMLVDCAKTADEQHTMLDGTVIAKSATGALFATLKSQDLELRKMREDSQLSKAIAQVSVDIPHVPGEPMVKAKMLMGIQQLDAAVRDTVISTLKAADDLWKARKAPAADQADGNGEVLKAGDKLEAMVKSHAEAEKVSHSVAYNAVLKTAEGRKLYSQSLEG